MRSRATSRRSEIRAIGVAADARSGGSRTCTATIKADVGCVSYSTHRRPAGAPAAAGGPLDPESRGLVWHAEEADSRLQLLNLLREELHLSSAVDSARQIMEESEAPRDCVVLFAM